MHKTKSFLFHKIWSFKCFTLFDQEGEMEVRDSLLEEPAIYSPVCEFAPSARHLVVGIAPLS